MQSTSGKNLQKRRQLGDAGGLHDDVWNSIRTQCDRDERGERSEQDGKAELEQQLGLCNYILSCKTTGREDGRINGAALGIRSRPITSGVVLRSGPLEAGRPILGPPAAPPL
jgi:hypothetical protein